MHNRCGLLLLTCGMVCVCVCACLSACDATTRYPAKTAGLIEMPFGKWSDMGPSNHVLDVGPDPPGEGAILG